MSQPFVGRLLLGGWNFAPAGWHLCDGSLLPIAQFETLFNLIGTTYGGDGQTTFAVPDLRGRVPVGSGQGPGLLNYVPGEKGGFETVTLVAAQTPAHTHPMLADGGNATSPIASGNTPAVAARNVYHPGASATTLMNAQCPTTTPLTSTAIGSIPVRTPTEGIPVVQKNHVRLSPLLVLVFCVLLPGAMAGQTAAPPVPLWPSDNRPPRNLEGHYVFLDEAANMIVIVIPGSLKGQPDQPPEIIRVPFHNRFEPDVAVSISKVEPNQYRYVYSFANGSAARDPVKGWIVAASCNDAQSSIDARPIGWHCTRIDDRFAKVRQFGLPYLSASGCASVCFLDGQQSPDSPTAQLMVVSSLKPGLTTASAENYPPYQVSQDWPKLVLDQVAKLGDPEWSNKHIVTLGPRFGTDASAAAIATDFLQGLAELVRTGRLASDSDFLKQLSSARAQGAQTGRVDGTRIVNSSTELGREIAEAVKLSLGSDSSL